MKCCVALTFYFSNSFLLFNVNTKLDQSKIHISNAQNGKYTPVVEDCVMVNMFIQLRGNVSHYRLCLENHVVSIVFK